MKTNAFFLTTVAALAVAAGIGLGGTKKNSIGVVAPVAIISVKAGSITYRLPGEYLSASKPVDAPHRTVEFPHGIDMMKFQVSMSDYERCVVAGACEPAEGRSLKAPETMPVTGVNFLDASAYAVWLSRVTGESWRLPTDAEWAYSAAERFADEAASVGDDANPSVRWLARYRSEASKELTDGEPKPLGYFDVNSNGLTDIAGNVWDWTATCYVRVRLSADGVADESMDNCGVRVVGGRHRGYMSYFIRDGKSGGCAAGIAPQNLGIRLVRDRPSMMSRLRNMLD